MRHKTLRSLLGKYICADTRVAFCHVDKIITMAENNAIATVLIKTLNNKVLHRIVEAEWTTDIYGVHKISNCTTIKEDELIGKDPTRDEALQQYS